MAIIPTAAVITFQDQQVLLVRHGTKATQLTDTYGFPGGTIEPEESGIDCAFREFTEETGLLTSLENLLEFPGNTYSAKIEKKDGSRHTYPLKVFLCSKFEGKLKTSGETTPVWINTNQLDSLNLLPNVKNAVTAGLKFINK